MKLAKVHVTNFRSVEDSGEFDVAQMLCLVGKNEAGKTAILQALAGLNPHPSTPVFYDLERDYPRRWLTEYSKWHQEEPATVVVTKWELSQEEKASITEKIGDALIDQPVTVYRRYEDAEPQWHLPIDYKKAIQNLIALEGLNEEERLPLLDADNSPELVTALEAIPERTQKQQSLLDRVNAFPVKSVRGVVTDILKKGLPYFLYSSHYDRMVGQLRLDTYNSRKQGEQPPPIEGGERVFVDFLEYAGTSLEEVLTATTYEGLNARCEAASSRITFQLLEYWTQNPFLEIEVRVTKAEANDPPPFNQGVIARARVKNNLHRMSMPFSERSAGFIWFFSFLATFAQVRKKGDNLILLLDEPGLTLHGKAQTDLLRYFTDKLAPEHQVIFTTHSPFMVPPDNLNSVRIVEDRILQPKPGQWVSEGTKVRNDAMATDRDTLFPLQGALGYQITQNLFVGKHTLLVEGPGDLLYLQAWSSALLRRGRTGIDRRWTICPAGGIDKIQPFVALFSGQKLDTAVLSDYSNAERKKFESLRQNRVMEGQRLLTFATILEREEASIEDVFDPRLYAGMLNQAFNLNGAHAATGQRLIDVDQKTTRLAKKASAYFRALPSAAPKFDPFTPADWLFQHPSLLDRDEPAVVETLERAERVILAINNLLE